MKKLYIVAVVSAPVMVTYQSVPTPYETMDENTGGITEVLTIEIS
jgi:hypothetical protein